MTSERLPIKSEQEVTSLISRLRTLTSDTGDTPKSLPPSTKLSPRIPSSAAGNSPGVLTPQMVKPATGAGIPNSVEIVTLQGGRQARLIQYTDGRQEFDYLPGGQVEGMRAIRPRVVENWVANFADMTREETDRAWENFGK